MLGTLLRGRYKIMSSLGIGGFSETYLAEDQDLPGCPCCVVKQLKPQLSQTASWQTYFRLFETEARVLYQLGNHEQIPRLLAHFTENQQFYLVQELIAGHELRQELAKGRRLKEAQVIALLQDILAVLEFVHQQGVIHRDLKPSNLIRRTTDGKLVLIDFGAVKQITTGTFSTQESLTVAVGTVGYMPPEQLRGKPRFSSDIYALGMVAIQALTGASPQQLPEDAQTGELVWRTRLQEKSPFLDMLEKMVRQDFRERYQTVQEVQQAISSLSSCSTVLTTSLPSHNPVTEINNLPSQIKSQRTLPGISSVTAPKIQLNRQEYHWRQILLNKVKNYWIKGVLETSLHGRALIELGLEESLDLVTRPWQVAWGNPDDCQQTLPAGTKVSDKFWEMGVGRSLLILGEPGSGKTTTLLELTRDLIEKIEQDISLPVPVVFNLSSWPGSKQSIADWLVQELNSKYQVAKEIGKNWINSGQLLLLLDGLDEVSIQLRNFCVLALNQFCQEHGTTEIVVCCRIQDYQTLQQHLNLQAAICLQPLTLAQIHHYLSCAGDELTAVNTAMQEDTTLQELAKSPLMLSIMTLAYRGISPSDLPRISAIEERRKHLFNTYIERMFQRRYLQGSYSKEQVKHWLSWLAKSMYEQSQTVFLIERLQPSYLETKGQKWLYAIGVGLIGGLIIGLAGGINTELIFLSGIGLTAGLILGIGGGLVAGLIFGFISQQIEPVEKLKWSWSKAKNSIPLGLRIGLIVGIILGLSSSLISWLGLGQIDALREGIPYGLSGLGTGLIFILLQGLNGGDIETSNIPNQGIWQSAKNALFVTLIGTMTMGVMALSLKVPLVFGVVIGILFGVFSPAGLACLQHLTLRLILFVNSYIPWNYAHFLDYATELIFLQKVGGGYIFVHRLLLEHFAQME
ncbi:MAG: protein kinase [Coleofasciculaceae cyanobacterium]